MNWVRTLFIPQKASVTMPSVCWNICQKLNLWSFCFVCFWPNNNNNNNNAFVWFTPQQALQLSDHSTVCSGLHVNLNITWPWCFPLVTGDADKRSVCFTQPGVSLARRATWAAACQPAGGAFKHPSWSWELWALCVESSRNTRLKKVERMKIAPTQNNSFPNHPQCVGWVLV